MNRKDIKFLLDCVNIEEFEVQCALAGIDMKDVVKELSFFKENGKYCIALDHFYWFDENGDKITAPKKINSDFDCSYFSALTSLEGAPHVVDGDFHCSYCISLTSFEGSPQEINGNFYCYKCNSLTSLDGGPQKVNGSFICFDCTLLTSLEGAPRTINHDFNCSECTSLTSLEGAPQKVSGDFNCSHCTSLTSLEGAPQEVGADFIFTGCDSLQVEQIDAFIDWLKTNPSQQYHDPFAKNETNESMQICYLAHMLDECMRGDM